MSRVVLLTLAGLFPTFAGADVVTLISGLDDREQVDLFACSVRVCMVEPVAEPRTQGDGAMRIRFYAHPSLDTNPQVAVNTRRQGLPYSNWQPYERIALDLFNPHEETLGVILFCKSGNKEYTTPLDLPPGAWTTAEVRIADLEAAGLDTSAITALGVRADMTKRNMPSRIVVDNVRLVGTDEAAIQQARAAEDARNAARPPRPRRRTDTAQGVVKLEPTGERIQRRVEAPVVATPEVLVVGGGLAGVAAAVTAARMGAETLLVERAGSLGGMATTGLVPPAFNRVLSEGIVAEFCRRLEQLGGRAQMWNPEIMKHVLLEMMRESGARLMLYSLAVDAIVKDNVIRGVIVRNKAGAQAILARMVIDCTGDGDVAAWAGAPFEIGRGRDDETQTQTLVFLLGNVDTAKVVAAREEIPDLAREARRNRELRTPFAAGAAIQPVIVGEHGVVNVNSINVPEVSGLKIEDLTYAHAECQREALELVDFYRKHVPGCEDCYLLSTAEFLGVRETRRIVGEYVLTGEEVLAGAQFPDGIARGFYAIDIHSPDGTGDAAGAHPSVPYEIPYRCLVPRAVDNLLVAGRCISADHVAHGSLRVMGTTMPLGEAAGCAAALCVFQRQTPRELSGQRVREMLKGLGAWPDAGAVVPDNLALTKHGAVATADSVLAKGGHAPSNATDGFVSTDMMSRWLSGDGLPPHWLQLEFAKLEAISRVRLHFFCFPRAADATLYIPRGFDVQAKIEEDWRTVASVRDNTELRPVVTFEPITTKIMRVLFVVSCPADDIVRLREIEVH